MTPTAAAATASAQIAAISAERGRRSRDSRREVHRLMVVASTRPQEGALGSVRGAAGLTACPVGRRVPANSVSIRYPR